MPVIKIDKSTLQAGLPIEPGWYLGVVKEIKTEPSKAGDSINHVTTLEITEGDNAGRQPKPKYFNSKGYGFMIDFIEAASGETINREEEFSFDLDVLVGKKLWFKVDNVPYEGRLQNEISGYANKDVDPNALPF